MKLRVNINVGKQHHDGKYKTITKEFVIEVTEEQGAMLRMNVEPRRMFSLEEKVDVKIEAVK